MRKDIEVAIENKETARRENKEAARRKCTLTIVGVGPGDRGMLTGEAERAIERADMVAYAGKYEHIATLARADYLTATHIGRDQHLETLSAAPDNMISPGTAPDQIKKPAAPNAEYTSPTAPDQKKKPAAPNAEFTSIPLAPLGEGLSLIETALSDNDVTVLVTGDPTTYSLMPVLTARFKDSCDIKVIPGIGAVNLLFSRLAEPTNKVRLLSVHGREFDEADIIAAVRYNRVCAIFLDSENNFMRICASLEKYGLGDVHVAVGINLSWRDEEIIIGSARELNKKYESNYIKDETVHILRTLNDNALSLAPGRWLKDSDIIRKDTPMTKEEVRIIAVSKLRLTHDCVMIDAGAGTGSIAAQCALLAPGGVVYAVERNARALQAIAENKMKFGLANLNIVCGEMPEALMELPTPTHLFVGGAGGRLADILDVVSGWGKGIRVVVTAVTLKTASTASERLSGAGFADFELIEVQINKQTNIQDEKSAILKGGNPVYIISAFTE